MESTLTYQWLVPQLIAFIGFMALVLIGIIGWVVNNQLSSMNKTIGKIELKVAEHVEKVEDYINKADERHFDLAGRVLVLEHSGLGNDKK